MSATPVLVREVAAALAASGRRLVTAESCTGGLIAAALTEVPGSSAWFYGGFVTYNEQAKVRWMGVPAAIIEAEGVVSEPVARAMATGALKRGGADLAVSVTGVAGPSGGDVLQPAGTVWFAWCEQTPGGPAFIHASRHTLAGDRKAVREAAVVVALQGVLAALNHRL